MDHESFEPLGRWEVERGSQQLGYDAWWHLGYDTMVTSEWGTPDTFEDGLVPEILLGSKYGRRLHFWDFTRRKHLQEIDFGEEHQLVFELRPAHDPTKAHGFVNCVISLKDLSSSIWTWYRDGDKWAVKKIISIPAEPANPDDLPPVLKGFEAVPPLVTDIDLSMDDRFLYVSCWGTGDLQQYDVSDPVQSEADRQGADRRHRLARHPSGRQERGKNGKLNGGPQMVEVSRDGRRVYFTNSLYGAVDPQFYPDGIDGWMVKLDAKPEGGDRVRPEILHRLAEEPPAAPGAPAGRRLLVRIPTAIREAWWIGPTMVPSEIWPWIALAGLGLFHGLNPAMGWLFAVALGLQRGSERIVLLALAPIAIGHAAAVAAVLIGFLALGFLVDRARCRAWRPRS